MPARFGFHIGPFYFSQRLGRTQAQKRAAAKAQAKAREAREWRKSPEGQRQHQQAVAGLERLNWLDSLTSTGPVTITRVVPYTNFPNFNVYFTPQDPDCPFRELTTVPDSIPGREHVCQGNVVEFQLERQQAVAVRLLASDPAAARTHRYRVTECSIDALKGGEFTLEAEGLNPVHIRLDAKSAVHFLSLKAGDIVQVTLAPGNAGIEEFWHISRANGAKPRPPIELTATDMQRLGLTANRSESGG